MPKKQQPILIRITAGRILKGLRQAARMSYGDATAAKLGSRAKLERIEAGAQGLSHADLALMCQVYQADDETRKKLEELIDSGHEDAWWERSGPLPEWFSTFIELESMAQRIRVYEGELIPGLLQSPAYQHAMFAVQGTENPDKKFEMRQKRQIRAFECDVAIEAVVGEGALKRIVGDHDVMQEQRAYLHRLDELEAVTVRILPYTAGAHPAISGPFNLLDFANADLPSVVYSENYGNGRYDSSNGVLDEFRHRWDVVRGISIPLKEHLK
jgi:hypothetical protein